MSAKLAGAAYGITTNNINIGPSLLLGLTMAPGVVGTYVRHVAGGTLYMAGFGSTAASHSTVVGLGHIVLAGGAPLYVPGPASLAFAAGATVTMTIIQLLGEGFAGSPGNP